MAYISPFATFSRTWVKTDNKNVVQWWTVLTSRHLTSRSIDGGSETSLNFHNYPEFDDGDLYKSR